MQLHEKKCQMQHSSKTSLSMYKGTQAHKQWEPVTGNKKDDTKMLEKKKKKRMCYPVNLCAYLHALYGLSDLRQCAGIVFCIVWIFCPCLILSLFCV